MLSAFEKLTFEKQKSILNAAAGVFAEEGYHYASISRICEKAGISNGALYKYFKNKEMLYLSVIDCVAARVEGELYIKYMENVESIFEGVRNLLEGMLDFGKENRDHLSIYSDLGSGAMNRFAAYASGKFKNATSSYTVKLVEMGKRNNEISKKIRSEIAACLIDNYITLFSYALVSEYHTERFDSFFVSEAKNIYFEDRIEIIIESLKAAFE